MKKKDALRSQQTHLASLLRTAPTADPAFVEPMKCRLVEQLPRYGEWHYKLKLDGCAVGIKTGTTVKPPLAQQ